MTSNWPSSNDSFTSHSARQPIASADINKIQDAVVALETHAIPDSGGTISGTLKVTNAPSPAATLPMGVLASNNSAIIVPSSNPGDDIAGGTDGTGRICLYSYQRANYNAFGEVLRVFLMRANAKAMQAYYGPQVTGTQTAGYDVNGDVNTSNVSWRQWVWTGAHYGANDGLSVHGHWSIEVPDAAGALRTRLEVPFVDTTTGNIGLDVTNIKTNQADFTVRTSNNQVLRLAGAKDTWNKDIAFSTDTEGTGGRRFVLRVNTETESGSSAGSNFEIRRYDDAGNFLETALKIDRQTGKIGLLGVTSPNAGLHLQRATGQIIQVDGLAATQSAFLVNGVDATVKALQGQVSGDTQKRFQILTDGSMAWGSGAAAQDTTLYRSAANVLKTDDRFVSAGLASTGNALGEAKPLNHSVIAWAYDPVNAVNSTVLTSGVQYLVALYVPNDVNCTAINWHVAVVAAGVTSSSNHIALYDSAGNRLATANVDADITSTGLKTTAISSTALTGGQTYYVSLITNATTPPAISRTTGLAGSGALVNVGLAASAYRFATNGTGKTTSPATFTPASNAQGIPLWAAIA